MEIGFDWSTEKNQQLTEQRGVSFELVVSAIEQGGLVDVLEHPNQDRYPGQLIYVVEIDEYLHLVPYVTQPDGHAFSEDDHTQPEGDERLSEEEAIVNDKMSAEERDILDRFQRDELRSAPGAEQEIEAARQAARNTFKKTKRVNLRVTERDFNLAHSRAREEGIPYQTLLSSVIHKYLSGRLTEKR